MRCLTLLPLLLLGGQAAASEPDQVVEITLSSFKFAPAAVRLEHGHAYLFRFVNRAGGGHDFVAKAFFAAATIAPADRATVHDGEVEVSGGETAVVHLVAPAPGHYRTHCSHFLHATMGMTGEIIVS